jgi:hypothetical protein
MNFTKTMLALAVGSVGIMGAMSAHAVAFNNGDALSITAGVDAFDTNGNFSNVSSGSWFGMDTNGNLKIAGSEKVSISQGTTGLVIGTTTSAGASHAGAPVGGDTNAITAPWNFFGNTGSDYLTVAATGSTDAGLDFSGWTVTWNGIPAIPMGAGAWGVGYAEGIANISWDGTDGGAYTLDYHGTVPLGDASGFGGVSYALHLEGTVAAVPEASTYGMMLAGLGLVSFAVRRRKPA